LGRHKEAMDHSVKSIVLLQDQLLQIFFDEWVTGRLHKRDTVQPEKPRNIVESTAIKETEREINHSNESNNIEVHNVFDGQQSSLESVLSEKNLLESPKKKESEEEMDFHDIYETRDSKHHPSGVKKNVLINLKGNTVMGQEGIQNPKSRFGASQLSTPVQEINTLNKEKFKEMPKVRDRLTILVIAYHNFAVELEYLGRLYVKLIPGLKESSLSFYEKTKRVNEYLLTINKLDQAQAQGPIQIGNEFTDKIQGIIHSMKSEIKNKKSKKFIKSRIKKKISIKDKPLKENKRPMTSKIPQKKRVKNSRIKSNITKLEAKKKFESPGNKSKIKSSQFHSREMHKRRIQSAYNGAAKTRKFRIRRKKGSSIRDPHCKFDMRYHYSGFKENKVDPRPKENWKDLIDQDTHMDPPN
jgi:hypothetical protein